jgi:LPS O-antigen subunit length determinant protein (WzzB/FepE family)
VVVTDPSTASAQKDETSMLAALFTKPGNSTGAICFQDVCQNLLRGQDALLSNTQVFVSQFTREAGYALQEVDHWKRRAAEYQKQNNELKQQHHLATQGLQQKLLKAESQVKARESKIKDLEQQLDLARKGRLCLSTGASGQSSQNSSMSGKPSSHLPFVRRMQYKEKEELAKERALNHSSRSFTAHDHSDSQSFPF